MLLTQQGNALTKPIYIVLGKLFELIFDLLSNFGVFNIGICIIIFTFVVKALLFPFSIKQQKSMKINQIIQPEISKIQKKYRGNNDNESMQKMNMEINAVYKKYGTSMTGGCMTTLIQLPILWSLYRLLNNIPAYVSKVKLLYSNMVAAIVASDSNYVNTINDFITNEKVSGYGLEKLSEILQRIRLLMCYVSLIQITGMLLWSYFRLIRKRYRLFQQIMKPCMIITILHLELISDRSRDYILMYIY